jgi:hypothetical protein
MWSPESKVVGAALSADVDAPTERCAFWKPRAARVNGRSPDPLGAGNR